MLLARFGLQLQRLPLLDRLPLDDQPHAGADGGASDKEADEEELRRGWNKAVEAEGRQRADLDHQRHKQHAPHRCKVCQRLAP